MTVICWIVSSKDRYADSLKDDTLSADRKFGTVKAYFNVVVIVSELQLKCEFSNQHILPMSDWDIIIVGTYLTEKGDGW